MNVGIDIRCLMDKNRTGVGEYTFGLLDNLFKHIDSTDFKKDYADNKDQFFLFYNSSKDVSLNIQKWERGNVHFVHTKYPNKLLNLLLFIRVLKLDHLVIKNCLKISNFKFQIDCWFSPNLNFTNLSKKIKHIQTVHDLSFEIMPEWFTIKQRLWHWFLNPHKQCRRADMIITPSENTKRDVVDRYQISDNKIQVLYPGISSHITNHISHIIDTDKDAKEKYILYLGTLEPRKNVLSIIEAFKQSTIFQSFSLIIAGSGGWKNKEVLQAIKNTPSVKYLGYVNEKEKACLYKNASLFVYPSLYEGFGLPVLEAMASGVPVITSNRSSLPEVVGDSAILVNPYNVAEIADVMERILKNENLRLKIIDRQKKWVDEFNWEKTAKKFIEILKNG